MGRSQRIGLIAAAVIVAVVAIVVLSGGDDDSSDNGSTAPAEVPTIVIKDGKPVGGIQDLEVNKGDTLEFRVKSDADHEIHLHGFDIAKDVKAGGSVTYNVKTDAPGIYEFEIEDTKTKIGQVKVEP
jgi:plastocyanin